MDGAFWQWNDIWLSPAFRDFDIRAECRRIEAPVLAIQGEDDPYGTLRQIDEIAPRAAAFERQVLPQCGHSPHRDQPDARRRAHRRDSSRRCPDQAPQRRQVGRAEPAPLARAAGPAAAPGAPIRDRCSALHPVADGGDHPLDLVVLAFGERQAQLPLARCARRPRRAPACGSSSSTTPSSSRSHLPLVDRVLDRDLVDLGHVVARRTHAVDELAVVGEQQQARGVLVQPAHRLHALHRALLRPLAQGRAAASV